MPTDAQIIHDSFSLLAPRTGELMDRFYDRLFAVAPGVRPLFPRDMRQQKQHLAVAVGLVAKNADRLESLTPALMDMGARHVKYGARPEHYPVVRDVLLDVLREMAGDAWTAEMNSAWTAALNAVAQAMLRGAQQLAHSAA